MAYNGLITVASGTILTVAGAMLIWAHETIVGFVVFSIGALSILAGLEMEDLEEGGSEGVGKQGGE